MSERVGARVDRGRAAVVHRPAPPDGTTWTLLVLKAGSEQGGSVENENEEFPDPGVGQTYSRSDGKGISHAILCHEPTKPPTTNTTEAPTTSTSEAPTTSTTHKPTTTSTSTSTSTSTVPGASTPTPPGSTPTQPVGNPPRTRGGLPVTGADIIPLTVIGATSVFVGAWLRRREQRQT